jgi:hypothetical protein
MLTLYAGRIPSGSIKMSPIAVGHDRPRNGISLPLHNAENSMEIKKPRKFEGNT